MMGKIPRVERVRTYGVDRDWWGELDDAQPGGTRLRVDSPAWFTWLAAPTTRTFSYPVYAHAHGYIDGFMTVRKEQRQRGGAYWVAYRRCHGRVRKVYLGATSRLTQACLDQVAQRLLATEHDHRMPDGKDDDSNKERRWDPDKQRHRRTDDC
jgi:hypothetical protein